MANAWKKYLDWQADQQEELMRKQIAANLAAVSKLAEKERSATSAQRQQDVSDLSAAGPAVAQTLSLLSPAYMALGYEAYGATEQTPLLTMLNMQAFTQERGTLRNAIEEDALKELSLAERITAEQERAATQQARAGAAARGMESGLATLSAEILNRDAYGQARKDARRQYAVQAAGMGMAEDQMMQTFAMNVENLNQAHQGNARNFLINAAQASVDPILRSVSLNRTNVSPAMPAQIMASAPTVASLAQAATPMLNYNMRALDTNLNASAAYNIAGANNDAGFWSGLMQYFGSMYQGSAARLSPYSYGYTAAN